MASPEGLLFGPRVASHLFELSASKVSLNQIIVVELDTDGSETYEVFPETRRDGCPYLRPPATLGAMACGQDGTPTPPPGPTLPTSQELRQAGDELFSAFSAAVQAHGGAAFQELLLAPLRERCTVEQVPGREHRGARPCAFSGGVVSKSV